MYGSLSVSVVKQMLRSYHLPHTQTSANVSIRQHKSAYVGIPVIISHTSTPRAHQSTSCPYSLPDSCSGAIRQHVSEYVSIRRNTSATSSYVSIRPSTSYQYSLPDSCAGASIGQHIRQHTSALHVLRCTGTLDNSQTCSGAI